MPVYWYRYRDDLWKKVIIYDGFHSSEEMEYDADFPLRVTDENERAQSNIEGLPDRLKHMHFATVGLVRYVYPGQVPEDFGSKGS